MSADLLRFIHASDFRLGQPIQGLRYIPTEWRDRLRDAPYEATANVFKSAVDENVDFILLSGDLIDMRQSSPFAVKFLLDQFASLKTAGIPIYWISGEMDKRSYWSKGITLPENVILFGSSGIESRQSQSNDGFQYTIVGSSFDGERSINTSMFAGFGDVSQTTIAACYGDVEIGDEQSNMVYWACGGLDEGRRIEFGSVEINYTGTPQPRKSTSSSSGCALVSISNDNVVVTSDMSVAAVHWLTLSVNIGIEDSLSIIQERCISLVKAALDRRQDERILLKLQLNVPNGHYLVGPRQYTIDPIVDSLIRSLQQSSPQVMVGEITVNNSMEAIASADEYDNVAKDFMDIAGELWTNGWGQLQLTDPLPDGMPIGMRLVREDLDGMRTINVAASYGANLLDEKGRPEHSEDKAA